MHYLSLHAGLIPGLASLVGVVLLRLLFKTLRLAIIVAGVALLSYAALNHHY
jgi:hypothetical protein